MDKNIKYLVFDLDDTLLRKDKSLSPYTIDVLKRAQKKGYKIVFNTSRSQQNSLTYINVIHPDYGIYNGGCLIVDKNQKELFSITIDKDKTKKITKLLNTLCEKISIQTKEHFYASDKEYKGQNAIWTNFKDGIEEETYKILCYSMDHDMIEKIADENGLEFQNYLNRGWHRLSIKGGTKWNGTLKLLELTGDTPNNVASFGDDFGDMEMIEKSAIGVAMKNSQPDVIKIAKNVTLSNDDDGAALFVEHNFL